MTPRIFDPRRGEFPVAGRLYKITFLDPRDRVPWVEYGFLRGIVVDPTDQCHGTIYYNRRTHTKHDDPQDWLEEGLSWAGIWNAGYPWVRTFEEVPPIQKGPGSRCL